MIKSLSLCFVFLFVVASSFAQRKKQKQFHYEPGMTHQEVLQEEQGRSELLIAEINKSRGKMEVYRYSLVGKMEAKQDPYYLYYMNDTLIRKSGPEDIEKGADLAIADYYAPLYAPREVKRGNEKKQQKEKKPRAHKAGWKTTRD